MNFELYFKTFQYELELANRQNIKIEETIKLNDAIPSDGLVEELPLEFDYNNNTLQIDEFKIPSFDKLEDITTQPKVLEKENNLDQEILDPNICQEETSNKFENVIKSVLPVINDLTDLQNIEEILKKSELVTPVKDMEKEAESILEKIDETVEDKNTSEQVNTQNKEYNSNINVIDMDLVEKRLKESGITDLNFENRDLSVVSQSRNSMTPSSRRSRKEPLKAKEMLKNKRSRQDLNESNIKSLINTPMTRRSQKEIKEEPNLDFTPIKLEKKLKKVVEAEIKPENIKQEIVITTTTAIAATNLELKICPIDYIIDTKIERKLQRINCTLSDADDSDVIICEKFSKNVKLLIAINTGKPILTPNWLEDSVKEKKVMPYDNYYLKDKDYEKKFAFDLRKMVNETPYANYLEGQTFYVADRVFNKDDLEDVITAAGGIILESLRTKNEKANTFVIADLKADKEEIKLLKSLGNTKIYNSDIILDSVYTQSLIVKNKYKL